MKSKEEEYKEIFLAEAISNYEELNKLMTRLEKNPEDKEAVNAIFRITHTLKGNAAGMGFKKVSEFAHLLEDIFGAVREDRLSLNQDLFATLFKAIDTLQNLIDAIKDNRKVKHLGVKTKLKVILRSAEGESEDENETVSDTKETEKKNGREDNKPLAKKAEINEWAGTEETTEDESEALPEEENAVEEEHVTKVSFSDLVQVPVGKLDNLLNLVGELIIERDRMIASHSQLNHKNEFSRLKRISSDLQYAVMDVRLVQVGFLFNKFHRVVRDAASDQGKKVDLQLKGTETEIDRNILQIISDSLIHLIRNAIGHGIETPEDRKKNNKPAEGQLTLEAFAENDAVYIKIEDDGKGIDIDKVRDTAINKGLVSKAHAEEMDDRDIALLIFEPGFSTMDKVNSIAGRGVGMDVVKMALDTIGGTVGVDTQKDKGTTFTLKLPSSMAVKGTLLFDVDSDQYAIPLTYTDSVVSLYKSELHKVGKRLAAVHSGKTIPVVMLKDLFDAGLDYAALLPESFDAMHPEEKLDIVVVHHNGRDFGLAVDKLHQQKEIVEKPLAKPVDHSKYFSGVTIMGNGDVCLVLNVPAISDILFNKKLAGKNQITN